MESRALELHALVDRFMDAWARLQLEDAMAMIAEDAAYDDLDGRVWRGRAEVRAAFTPDFLGERGVVRFTREDTFVDPEADEALVRWTCTVERAGIRRAYRGVDVLRFRGLEIVEKLTYAKTSRPTLART